MLLYLFAVCDNAAFLYHSTAVPSGIEYLPARESMLHFKQLPDAEEEQEHLDKKPVSMAIDEIYSGKLTLKENE